MKNKIEAIMDKVEKNVNLYSRQKKRFRKILEAELKPSKSIEELIEKRWHTKWKEYDEAESDIWVALCREIELDLQDLLPEAVKSKEEEVEIKHEWDYKKAMGIKD